MYDKIWEVQLKFYRYCERKLSIQNSVLVLNLILWIDALYYCLLPLPYALMSYHLLKFLSEECKNLLRKCACHQELKQESRRRKICILFPILVLILVDKYLNNDRVFDKQVINVHIDFLASSSWFWSNVLVEIQIDESKNIKLIELH